MGSLLMYGRPQLSLIVLLKNLDVYLVYLKRQKSHQDISGYYQHRTVLQEAASL